MRWVHRIPHRDLAINIYETESRFSIKIEAGPMEQTYKIKKDVVPDLKSAIAFVDDAFIQSVLSNFEGMFATLKQSISKFNHP